MQGEAECESDFELRKPMAEGFVPCIWNGQVTRGREVDGKWIILQFHPAFPFS
jgi:hypothetical protein